MYWFLKLIYFKTNYNMKTWKTDISTVYWSNVHNANIEKAKLCLGDEIPHEVSWLDELFGKGDNSFKKGGNLPKKGIKVFEKDNNPVTLLIKGPPGSGKTTFTLELCYRLSLDGIRSTYVSFESKGDQIMQNIENYKWEKHEINMKVISQDTLETSLISICGSEQFESWYDEKNMFLLNSITSPLYKYCGLKLNTEAQRTISNILKINKVKSTKPQLSQILVIDSLNIIPTNENKSLVFQEFLKITKDKKNKLKLLIFILDGKSGDESNPFWEYMCDNVIELNHYMDNNYFIRTIEILKSRFQQHILGKHQFKIFGKPEPIDENNKINSRMHPINPEGGIFIFPSVHFYLSKYRKFQQYNELEYNTTYPPDFSDFLSISKDIKGGFPKGRCTALIGCRGGHKSHLGYLHILSRLTGNYNGGNYINARKEAAIIISLRDDETMITTTLDGILRNEFPIKNNNEKDGWSTKEIINEGRLEILYYPPGYISPEEFIHRIFVSIHKFKDKFKNEKDTTNITVIFNSLDQLAARFPLCAKLDIFIPSIIQILIGESITSIFIAVDEKDQPAGQYGLIPMADLILSFHQYQMKQSEYDSILDNKKPIPINDICRDEIILTVERFAGGKKAGDKGLLELNDADHKINFVTLPKGVYLEKSRLIK